MPVVPGVEVYWSKDDWDSGDFVVNFIKARSVRRNKSKNLPVWCTVFWPLESWNRKLSKLVSECTITVWKREPQPSLSRNWKGSFQICFCAYSNVLAPTHRQRRSLTRSTCPCLALHASEGCYEHCLGLTWSTCAHQMQQRTNDVLWTTQPCQEGYVVMLLLFHIEPCSRSGSRGRPHKLVLGPAGLWVGRVTEDLAHHNSFTCFSWKCGALQITTIMLGTGLNRHAVHLTHCPPSLLG